MSTPGSFSSGQAAAGSRSRRKPAGGLLVHLSALLLFVLCFAGTMLVLLPKAQLRDHVVGLIYKQTGLRISIGELSLSPFLRVEARDIAWQPEVKGWPPVTVDRLSLSPHWTRLFGNNPAARFQAAVAEGTATGWQAKDGSFSAILTEVNFAPYLAADFPFPPTGRISGTITADRQADSDAIGFDLVADDLKLTGLSALGLQEGALSLGRLRLRGKMKGQTLNLESLRNEGGDLSLTGNGTILLNKLPERCRLNLQIELRPGAGLASTVHDLLLLGGLEDDDGDYSLRLTGTLARPVLR
jgi:type II secretion system protein N